jgi:hypothetical protein
MDFKWVTSDDANAIQNTIVDAKGDLIAASASDVPARLAVGANGETLVADSSAATGLKWAKSPNFVGCVAYLSGSDQTLSNAVQTAINMPSETIDTDGFHSTSTNTSRLTIPTGFGGKYRVSAMGRYSADGTGRRITGIAINGTTTKVVEPAATSSAFVSAQVTAILSLSATDYVELTMYQDTGGPLGAVNGVGNTWIELQYLGA